MDWCKLLLGISLGINIGAVLAIRQHKKAMVKWVKEVQLANRR